MAIDKVVSASIADDAVTSDKVSYNKNQFRNIIINGDMSVSQRSTSTSSITGNGYHTIDRYQSIITSQGTWTQSQSTDVPSGQGFAKSFKWDCTTADASPAAGDRLFFGHKIEGQNLQYLKKGTANAESLTLSFWVKSNKTGTYIIEIQDEDNGRQISQAYTISSADTWEKKTLTFDGDTSGTLDNDNATSLAINFWLGGGSTYTGGTLNTTWGAEVTANRAVGQVNLADNTSNEWYITGVQLEAGTSASDFEFLPVDVNLERCKRYFQTKGTSLSPNAFTNNQTVAMGLARTVSSAQCYMELNPIMRSEPTVSGIGTLSNLKCHTATGGNVDTSSIGADGTPNRQQVTYIANNLTSGLNNNEPIRLYGDYTITFDGEL